MPYIDKAARPLILAGHPPSTAGELNFLITMLVIKHARARQTVLVGKLLDAGRTYIANQGISYAHINDVMGAYVCAGLELQRRTAWNAGIQVNLLREVAMEFYTQVAAPYEDTKIGANGDLPFEDL